MVQSIPFGEVITRFPVPRDATAQNRPSSGLQQTERQSLSAALLRTLQLLTTNLPMPAQFVAFPTKFAVIVPAEKFPLASRLTILFAVLAETQSALCAALLSPVMM
jgi:hypothetical protein